MSASHLQPSLSDQDVALFVKWRRHLHAFPELEFETIETARFVEDALRQMGCDRVELMVGGSAVVAKIEGERSGGTVALRADMDALPIAEATHAEWRSTRPGLMHACGHDGHTAVLLAAAHQLCANRAFPGAVILLFQPAEETGGGARAMLEDGLLDVMPFDEIYGAHNEPGLDVGAFGCRAGVFAASSDLFDVRLTGKGTHAAQPHEGIDPLAAAVAMHGRLSAIPGQLTCATRPAVVTVTSIVSDTDAYNIVPHTTALKGTVRTLDEATRDEIQSHFERIVRGLSEAHQASYDIDYRRNYPVLVNTPEQTSAAADIAETLGPVQRNWPVVMGTEDFAMFLGKRPGAYILYGNGDTEACHHPGYDFNDAALPYAASWFVQIALARLCSLESGSSKE